MSIILDLKSSVSCIYFHCDVCKCGSKIDRNKSNNDRIVLECPTCKENKEFITGNFDCLFVRNLLADFLYKLRIEYNQRSSTYETDKRSLTEWMTDKIFENIIKIKNDKKNLKEVLGKHAENIKSYVNCIPKNTVGVIPPKSDTFTFSSGRDYNIPNDSGLRECARALVDKLNLIEKDGRCANIFVFAANHGCTYNGPDYEKELKDLKKALENYDI